MDESERRFVPSRVAKRLGVTARHLNQLCQDYALPRIDVSRPGSKVPRWRYPESTVRRLEALVTKWRRAIA